MNYKGLLALRGKRRKLCKFARSVQNWTVYKLELRGIVTHGVFRNSTCLRPGFSLLQESEFKNACVRCEILSGLRGSGEKGFQVWRKRNGLCARRSRNGGHVHSRRRREAFGGQ